MKKIQILFLFLIPFTLCSAQDITGKWYGNPQVGAIKLRIIFDIQKTNDGYQGIMLSPDQTNQEFNADQITFLNDTLTINVKTLNFIYKGTFKEGENCEGLFVQNGMPFQMNLSRTPILLNRPQEPKPPYPYTSEDITFRNERAGITLAGTLTLPSIEKKTCPAVVLITGSGPQNRDEELLGHKPFLVLADYLTRNGIVVLRYDDRGFGESEGIYADAVLLDHAEDARSALHYLKNRKEVDSRKTGALGHSMGGTIALVLAAEKEVAFVVSLAGMGTTGSELLNQQREALLKASGAPDEFIDSYNSAMNQAEQLALKTDDKELLKTQLTELFQGTSLAGQEEVSATQLLSPEIKSLVAFDPQSYLIKITCPVLALNGEKDLQVLAASNLRAIEEGISPNGNKNVNIKSYPGLNHLFQPATTGLPKEYGQIEESISPQVLFDIFQWISEQK